MLSHKMLDIIDPIWSKALRQADLPVMAKALETYKDGYSIPDETADAIAYQIFTALLYNGEAQ